MLSGFLLLTGPPGCGKSMAARAFAETLARRRKEETGTRSLLVEVRMHMLFSDLLGKSAKAIAHAFQEAGFSARARQTIVLIEEMDSLGTSRARLSSGDPTDVFRAVNELLRQLDAARDNPHLVVLATSNFVGRLDEALLDRADFVLTFDLPDVRTATAILFQAARDAERAGIHVDGTELSKVANELCGDGNEPRPSGRLLSKLPLLGYLEAGSLRPCASEIINVARQKMTQEAG